MANPAPIPIIVGIKNIPNTFAMPAIPSTARSITGLNKESAPNTVSAITPKTVNAGDRKLPTISTTYPITSNITLNAGTTNCRVKFANPMKAVCIAASALGLSNPLVISLLTSAIRCLKLAICSAIPPLCWASLSCSATLFSCDFFCLSFISNMP